VEFEFNEDQTAIRDLAAGVFDDYCADDQLQQFWRGDADYDAALWQQLRDTGLAALTLAEADGGSGLGMLELMLVLEQQGRRLAPVPLWRHQLATAALAAFAGPALKTAQLATLALDGLTDSRGLGLRAEPNRDGWRLHGRAVAVAYAEQAALVLLPAQTSAGVRLFALAPTLPGIERVPGLLTQREPAADLHFDAVAVPNDAALDAAALGWLEPRAIAALAALQLGVSAEALRRAVAYTGERQQFGRPLASFQALSQKVADCYLDVEALRSTLWQLCWRLDAGLDTALAAPVAKSWACDCGHRVSHAAQHMHGGIGVDTSYPIHRFTLWSRALELSLGGVGAQLETLGRQLAAGAAI
jgi:alkylation response protein AidB-like acyl-CoA dehydrogenase